MSKEGNVAGAPSSRGIDVSASLGAPWSRWLTDAAAGVLLVLATVALLNIATVRLWISDPTAAMLLSYLAVWVPLLSAVAVACFRHGSRSLVRDFGLRFRAIDLLWGLSLGLLARVGASLIEIAIYGQMGTASASFGETVYDLTWLFAAVLAPILCGPFVEELFFRGLLLRAIERATAAHRYSRRAATASAIVVSSLVFAFVHLMSSGSPSAMLAIGLSTLLFGLAAATVAALTGRLGGALIAHVTFNALVVVPALLP